jgi:hypothetical protein
LGRRWRTQGDLCDEVQYTGTNNGVFNRSRTEGLLTEFGLAVAITWLYMGFPHFSSFLPQRQLRNPVPDIIFQTPSVNAV